MRLAGSRGAKDCTPKLKINQAALGLRRDRINLKKLYRSTIIQEVMSNHQSELTTIVVARFYFDFNLLDKKRTEKLTHS